MLTLRFLLAISICLAVFSNEAVADDLFQSFASPPDSSRPGVYWYFMDGNIDPEEMTKDLESMKRAGIGNLIFLEVNVGVPRGPVDFMSEQWQDLFVHAAREAQRLGIEISLGSGPGWSGSGGPWNAPEDSMQHLVFSETQVKGPSTFEGLLPVPPQRKIDFLVGRDEWFEDVKVLAIPKTDDRLREVDRKALFIRYPFSIWRGNNSFAYVDPPVARSNPDDQTFAIEQVLDLSDAMQPDGRLRWQVPRGE
ncbi:glycosyl hydrolase, partial [Rhodopirellula sallentina]